MGVVTANHSGLIASDHPLQHQIVTLAAGQNLTRGAILGIANVGTAASAAKSGGNTGNGALTLASPAVLTGAESGIYQVRCTAAATNGGTFTVTDPSGNVLGTVDVGDDFAEEIAFYIADSSTDFIVGDGFDVTVASGSGHVKLATLAATDGSDEPIAVLAEDVDASAAAVTCPAYVTGEFAHELVTYGEGHNRSTVNAAFLRSGRAIRIHKLGVA